MFSVRRSGRPPGRPHPPYIAVIALLAFYPRSSAATPTTDCFADRVAALTVGVVNSPPAFNTWQPGIVLGPPGNSTPTTGSLSVLSLGRGGSITLEFTDNEIIDGPGSDFIVFENPFFCGTVPPSASDPFGVFAEPGFVAVSEDGVTFASFPHDTDALGQVVSLCSDGALTLQLVGLAGITPSFTGDYTIPDDPLVFDPSSPGGVSGHGGDAFDLAEVGLTRARFVRITDPNLSFGLPGSTEGFDLDAVTAIHSRPLPGPVDVDTDGDGLPDDAETALYLTDPSDPDSDGDGVSDGDEAASCRDPRTAGGGPWFLPAIDLEMAEPMPSVVRWNSLGPGAAYDVVRGAIGAPLASGGQVDLGVVTCIENDSTDLTTRTVPDGEIPPPGDGFFYLIRRDPGTGGDAAYGRSSSLEPRHPASGGCP